MNIEQKNFSKTNTKIKLFTLKNENGLEIKITNYGGIITSWLIPDKNGNKTDIVLGFNSYEKYREDKYLNNCPYFGAIIGRFANRIAKGKFTLKNTEYNLAINNGENHLHGGTEGFDKKVWDATTKTSEKEVSLILNYLSPDGEENYPGNLDVTVIYTLNNNNELKVKYLATSDKETPLNLTQHTYFNLKGEGNGDILNHSIEINADKYTKPDENSIPTGEFTDLTNNPFDLRKEIKIQENINKLGNDGYDHNYILNKKNKTLSFAAKATEPETGRILEVFTTKPGIQFYTAKWLDSTLTGKSGKIYKPNAGFCLETQFFPDSPNKPEFPSSILKVGEKYEHETVFKVSI